MTKGFYEFDHKCERMPYGVSFCKINGSSTSQFTLDSYKSSKFTHSTTLYGFRYCPYCGKDMEVGNDSDR